MSSSALVEIGNGLRWRILTTAPLPGVANMDYDRTTLERVQRNDPPVLRFFRFVKPTVSYGRHQSLDAIQDLIPDGWETVQRPTGGGIVFHDEDLCVSLCWRQGQSPMPYSVRDHYAWIHRVMREALSQTIYTELADCTNIKSCHSEFATRQCFTEPVAFDVLLKERKIIGGALCRRRDTFLYQGSIQYPAAALTESLLRKSFEEVFAAARP